MRFIALTSRATVPKATVDEDSYAFPYETKVRPTRNIRRMSLPAAQTAPDQARRHAHFSRAIFSRSHLCHPRGSLPGSERVAALDRISVHRIPLQQRFESWRLWPTAIVAFLHSRSLKNTFCLSRSLTLPQDREKAMSSAPSRAIVKSTDATYP